MLRICHLQYKSSVVLALGGEKDFLTSVSECWVLYWDQDCELNCPLLGQMKFSNLDVQRLWFRCSKKKRKRQNKWMLEKLSSLTSVQVHQGWHVPWDPLGRPLRPNRHTVVRDQVGLAMFVKKNHYCLKWPSCDTHTQMKTTHTHQNLTDACMHKRLHTHTQAVQVVIECAVWPLSHVWPIINAVVKC